MKHLREVIAVWAVTLLMALGLSAGPAAAQTPVSFALPSKGFLYIPLYVAAAKGYLAEEGLKEEIVYLKGGSEVVNALISGAVNISLVDPIPGMRAHEKGADVVVFGAEMNQYASNLVVQGEIAEKAGITRNTAPADRLAVMKGLRLGITGVGGTPDLLLRYLARQAGLKPDSDVTLVPLGTPAAMTAAFAQKRIDGFALSSPTSDLAVKNFGAFMLVNLARGEYPPLAGYPAITMMTTKRWLDANPAVAKGVSRAFRRAMELMMDHPEEAKAALRTFFKDLDPAVFEVSVENNLPAYPRSPALTDDGIAKVLDFFRVSDGHAFGAPSEAFFVKGYAETSMR